MSSLTNRLKELVRTETSAAARKEWNMAQGAADDVLYDYRLDHVRQVVSIAKHLASETGADEDVVALAAWLHDIAKPGLEGIGEHGARGAERAHAILSGEGIDRQTLSRVSDAIRNHVGLVLENPLDSLESQVIWEADKIVKLGITGLIHFIVNGIRIEPGRDLKTISNSIHEFLDLAQRIADSMHTSEGRKMAQQRLRTLQYVSRRLDAELNLEE